MHRLQRVLGVLGTAGVALGLVVMVLPEVVDGLTTRQLLVPGIGLLALVQAVRVVRARRDVRATGAETPTPEPFAPRPTPGASFETSLASVADETGIRQVRAKRAVRDRLVEAAISVMAHRADCSEAAARQRLEAGRWTDDTHAAAFLASDRQSSLDWSTRLRLRMRGESPFAWRARRTMDAIARIDGSGGDGPSR
jgi:hypothetical protein